MLYCMAEYIVQDMVMYVLASITSKYSWKVWLQQGSVTTGYNKLSLTPRANSREQSLLMPAYRADVQMPGTLRSRRGKTDAEGTGWRGQGCLGCTGRTGK